MKNILLLVHEDAGQEARLQAALDITRALEGHLTCLDVVQLPMLVGDYYSGVGEAMLLAEGREQEARNRKEIEARLAHEEVPWSWIDATGNLAECATDAAGLADLIVVNRRLDAFPVPDMRGIAGAILMRARKPIVAMPDGLRGFAANGRALIAWDGSDPVMATMQACVPLLRLASAVRLYYVDDGSQRISAEDAAIYLSRHDIHADIHRVDEDLQKVDARIVAECAAWRADYCLMGAFSRSRVTEALFGGVTRRMLGSCNLPLILGH